MSVIELKLRTKEGKVEYYSCDFVPARKYLEYLKMEEELENKRFTSIQAVEKRTAFVASVFEGVKAEDLYDGLSAVELTQALTDITNEIMGIGDADPKESESV